MWNKFVYSEDLYEYAEAKVKPFDGKEYLLKTNIGCVSARWCPGEWSKDTPISASEYSGFCWVCYDDEFQLEIDEVDSWMKIPL